MKNLPTATSTSSSPLRLFHEPQNSIDGSTWQTSTACADIYADLFGDCGVSLVLRAARPPRSSRRTSSRRTVSWRAPPSRGCGWPTRTAPVSATACRLSSESLRQLLPRRTGPPPAADSGLWLLRRRGPRISLVVECSSRGRFKLKRIPAPRPGYSCCASQQAIIISGFQGATEMFAPSCLFQNTILFSGS